MAVNGNQFLRKASLLLVRGQQALDLSAFRFTFRTQQSDIQSPNNCAIRVYNLTPQTMAKVQGEYSEVVLQAGYKDGNYGVIFQGTIRQFRLGKEGAKDTYLDILAADGDLFHNLAFISKTFGPEATASQRVQAIASSLGSQPVGLGYNGLQPTGGTLPRGKVLHAMARVALSAETQQQGATWNINAGKINIIPVNGYLPGEVVVLNARTGLIGRPEQTQDGITARCLLNSLLVPGGLLQIDNASINRTVNANPNAPPVPYNQNVGLQFLADVTADGFYRVYVAEHVGDTRGNDWYTELVCLSVDRSTKKVLAAP